MLAPLVPTAAVAGPTSAATPGRAMWVWTEPDPQALVDFAEAHGVDTLFVAVDRDVATSGDLPRLRRLAGLAAGAGIRLQALGGDPAWTTDHTSALAWQRAAVSTGLFSGVHVDVEPYALSGWSRPKTRARLVSSYLHLLDTLHQDLAGTGLGLEADVPFWCGTIASGRSTLADRLLRRVDGVSVMSYRDRATGADSITDIGADMLARAALAGVPARLGAETNPLPDCAGCTFFEEGAAALDTALAQVDATESGAPAYAGMAVEDYDGWRDLRP